MKNLLVKDHPRPYAIQATPNRIPPKYLPLQGPLWVKSVGERALWPM